MRCSNGKSDSVRMKFTFWFKCLANEKDLSRMRPVPFWSLVSSLFLSVPLLLALTCSSFSFFFSHFFLYLSRRFSTLCLFLFFRTQFFPIIYTNSTISLEFDNTWKYFFLSSEHDSFLSFIPNRIIFVRKQHVEIFIWLKKESSI